MGVLPSVTVVLDAMRKHGVRALLMGGQACIAYGASEFTRDIDLVVVADDASLAALSAALRDLQAESIAVPQLDRSFLAVGHAVHFRCRAPGVEGVRVDVMSTMRGVDPFEQLWDRRVTLANGIEVLSLPDLVKAKKTQRDKDWPMLRRLIEVDYFARRDRCTEADVSFWLRECRTPAILIELARAFPRLVQGTDRPAVRAAAEGMTESQIAEALALEARLEREADRVYWAPLKAQLEELRRARSRKDEAGGDAPP